MYLINIDFNKKNTLFKFTSSSFINAYQIFSVWNADRAPGILLNSEIEKKNKSYINRSVCW